MTPYKVLELFFGNGSFSRTCLELDLQVIGSDILPCPSDLEHEIEFIQDDILHLDPGMFKDISIIWASPPCETYSVVGFSNKHRSNCEAITEKARLHDSYIIKTLEIIEKVKPKFWIIENPIACLRKQSFMKDIPNAEVTYCQYGLLRMKPTDLFGILPKGFKPKRCKNGDPCHVASPRGSKTGTSSIPKFLRARIPFALCYDIASHAKGEMKHKQRWLYEQVTLE